MKQYNLSTIMSAAWRIFRKGVSSFAVALRLAWANAKAHNAAKEAAGITEETHTWEAGVIWDTRYATKAKRCTRQSRAIRQPRAAPG